MYLIIDKTSSEIHMDIDQPMYKTAYNFHLNVNQNLNVYLMVSIAIKIYTYIPKQTDWNLAFNVVVNTLSMLNVYGTLLV